MSNAAGKLKNLQGEFGRARLVWSYRPIELKARRLIEASTFEPETLKVVCKAFDDAWAQISYHFAGDHTAAEHARVRLAHAVEFEAEARKLFRAMNEVRKPSLTPPEFFFKFARRKIKAGDYQHDGEGLGGTGPSVAVKDRRAA